MPRFDNRAADAIRPTRLTPHVIKHAEGSVLVEVGDTRVVCMASVEERVPPFRRNSGKGWVTAEYGMLPRSTSTRSQRAASAGKVRGRTQEIQRLIGRSLRAVTDMVGPSGPASPASSMSTNVSSRVTAAMRAFSQPRRPCRRRRRPGRARRPVSTRLGSHGVLGKTRCHACGLPGSGR